MSAPTSRNLFLAAALSLAGFVSMAAAQAPATAPVAATGSAPITTVAEAFARWPDLTTDDVKVRLEGVVTGVMPASGAFRMHDGELGIYVTRYPVTHKIVGPKLTPGDRVAVTGVLRKGGFSPWMTPHEEVTVLGRGVYPEARPATFNLLASGAADNQWLEIEGVVRGVQVPEPKDFVMLDVGMSGGSLRVLVNHEPNVDYPSLVDAAVRMRGVAAVSANAYKQIVEPSFRVPSFSEITVIRPGQADAFAQPLVPVPRLMRFSLGAVHQHRVHTSGVVLRRLSETTFFVRDGGVGLKVESNEPQNFQPGDVIEAAGFPVMVEGMAVLQRATCRAMGVGTPPAAVQPSIPELLTGAHNSNLVTVRARLVDWVAAGASVTLILQAGDQLFKGHMNLSAETPLLLPDKNSLVNVTGICVISELEDIWFYRPRSFLLLVADRADLQLVQAPPWWTPERLWRALAITGFVLLAVGGWVWALRRQIGRKRAVIEQQARHAAALEERSRIARELHDTLEQGLTGLSLQMKAMETDLDGTPHPVRSRLHFARQMLRQSRALARNAIRELRAETIPGRFEGLIDGLKRVADGWNHSGALAVTLRIAGEVRPLPARIEQHLLGIGTEAMTNAVKHGRADAIHVEVKFGAADIALSIQDDGAGFDPALHLERMSGCFGLIGMRERARELNGEVRIHSQPGHGAEVIVTAPIALAPDGAANGQAAGVPAAAISSASAAT